MNARQVLALRTALAAQPRPSTGLARPHISYRVFVQINQKSKTQTIKDLFVKQLVQVRTIGADKAAAIVQQYPTMSHLVTAYETAATEDDRRHLLADVLYGSRFKKRKIGPVASQSVYQAVYAPTVPTDPAV